MKLAIGFAACLVLSTILGAVAINRMNKMDATMRASLSDSVGGLHDLALINSSARRIRTLEFQHLVANTDAERSTIENDLAACIVKLSGPMNDYEATITDPVDTQNFKNLKSDWQSYLDIHDNVYLPLSRRDKDREAAALLNGSMKQAFLAYTGKLDALLQWNDDHGQCYERQAAALAHSATLLIIGLLIMELTLA